MKHLETLLIEKNESLVGLSINDGLYVRMNVADPNRWMPIMLNPRLRRKHEMFMDFGCYPYLDDIYFDRKMKRLFDKFVIDWMENRHTGKIYTHYVFRLRRNSLDELENTGFLEWLYYTLIIFKDTRSNVTLMIDPDRVHEADQPIECKIVRDFADPRLNLCLSSSLLSLDQKKILIPEDVGCYTTLISVADPEDDPDRMSKRFGLKNAISCDLFDIERI